MQLFLNNPNSCVFIEFIYRNFLSIANSCVCPIVYMNDQIKVKAVPQEPTIFGRSTSDIPGVEKRRKEARAIPLTEKGKSALQSGLTKALRDQGVPNPESQAKKAVENLTKQKQSARPGGSARPPSKFPRSKTKPRAPRFTPSSKPRRKNIFERTYDKDIGYAQNEEDFRLSGIFGGEGMVRFVDSIFGSEEISGASLYKEMHDARVTVTDLFKETLEKIGLEQSNINGIAKAWTDFVQTLTIYYQMCMIEPLPEEAITLSNILSMQLDKLEDIMKDIAGIESDNPLYHPGVRTDYFLAQFGAFCAGSTMKCPDVDVKFDLMKSVKENMVLPPTKFSEMKSYLDFVHEEAVDTFSSQMSENLGINEKPPTVNSYFEDEEEPMISKEKPSERKNKTVVIPQSKLRNFEHIGPKRSRRGPVRIPKGKEPLREEEEEEEEEEERRKSYKRRETESRIDETLKLRARRLLDLGYEYGPKKSGVDFDRIAYERDETQFVASMTQTGVGVSAIWSVDENNSEETLIEKYGTPGKVQRDEIERQIRIVERGEDSTIDRGVDKTIDDNATLEEEVMRARQKSDCSIVKDILSKTDQTHLKKEELKSYRKTYFWAMETLSGRNKSIGSKITRSILTFMFSPYTLFNIGGMVSTFLKNNDPLTSKIRKPLTDIKNDIHALSALIKNLEDHLEKVHEQMRRDIEAGKDVSSLYQGMLRLDTFIDPDTMRLNPDRVLSIGDSLMIARQAGASHTLSLLQSVKNDIMKTEGREPTLKEYEEEIHDWTNNLNARSSIGTFYHSEIGLFTGVKMIGERKDLLRKAKRLLQTDTVRDFTFNVNFKGSEPSSSYNYIISEVQKSDNNFKRFLNTPFSTETHARALAFLKTENRDYLEEVKVGSTTYVTEKGHTVEVEFLENPASLVAKWFRYTKSATDVLMGQKSITEATSIYLSGRETDELVRALNFIPERAMELVDVSKQAIFKLGEISQLMMFKNCLNAGEVKRLVTNRDPISIMTSILQNMLQKSTSQFDISFGVEAGRRFSENFLTQTVINMISVTLMSSLGSVLFVQGAPSLYENFSSVSPSPEQASSSGSTSSWSTWVAETLHLDDESLSNTPWGIFHILSGTSMAIRFAINFGVTLATNHLIKILTTIPGTKISVTRLPYVAIKKCIFKLADWRLKSGFLFGSTMADAVRDELDNPSDSLKFLEISDVDKMNKLFEVEKAKIIQEATTDEERELAEAKATSLVVSKMIETTAWMRNDDPFNMAIRLLGFLIQDFVGPSINQISYMCIKQIIAFFAFGPIKEAVKFGAYCAALLPEIGLGTSVVAVSSVVTSVWGSLVVGTMILGSFSLALRTLRGLDRFITAIQIDPFFFLRTIAIAIQLLFGHCSKIVSSDGIMGATRRMLCYPYWLFASKKKNALDKPCNQRGSKGILSLSPSMKSYALGVVILVFGIYVYQAGWLEDLVSLLPENLQPPRWIVDRLGRKKQIKAAMADEILYTRRENESDADYQARILSGDPINPDTGRAALNALKQAKEKDLLNLLEYYTSKEAATQVKTKVTKEPGFIQAARQEVFKQLSKPQTDPFTGRTSFIPEEQKRNLLQTFTTTYSSYWENSQEGANSVRNNIVRDHATPEDAVSAFIDSEATGLSKDVLLGLGIVDKETRSQIDKTIGEIEDKLSEWFIDSGRVLPPS